MALRVKADLGIWSSALPPATTQGVRSAVEPPRVRPNSCCCDLKSWPPPPPLAPCYPDIHACLYCLRRGSAERNVSSSALCAVAANRGSIEGGGSTAVRGERAPGFWFGERARGVARSGKMRDCRPKLDLYCAFRTRQRFRCPTQGCDVHLLDCALARLPRTARAGTAMTAR